MRARVNDHVAATIHRLALREARSDQEMVDRILQTGMRVLGGGTAPVVDDVESHPDKNGTYDMRLSMPEPKYRMIRELANRDGRSARGMLRQCVDVGLKTMMATPADTDAQP